LEAEGLHEEQNRSIGMSPRTIGLVFAVADVLNASGGPLYAAIIRVGPGGDFSDIQPAIDAAVDGDVILVEPGTYNRFRLAKGVVIRSAAPGRRFDVQAVYAEPSVVLEHTAPSQKAAISGKSVLVAVTSVGWDAFVWLRNCQGELILDNVAVVVDLADGYAHNRRLLVESCTNVAIVDLQATTRSNPYIFSGYHELPTAEISSSQVRISNSELHGTTGYYNGPIGVLVKNSLLVLSSTNVFGGNAEDCTELPGDGGDGIVAVNSHVVIIGDASHRVEGGDGSDARCYGFAGGDGGAGFRGESATVSFVGLKAGLEVAATLPEVMARIGWETSRALT
jgi:hypothetical protein